MRPHPRFVFPRRTLTAVLAALAAAPAIAGTETLLFQQTVPMQSTDWSNPLTFPKFDPALGILTDVIFTLDVVVQGSASFENLGPNTVNVTGQYAADVILRHPDTSFLARVQFNTLISEQLAPFDGALDFAGASGRSLTNLGGSGFQIADLFSAEFPPFVGPSGNPGTITLPLAATAFTSISAFPNMTKNLGSEARAIVRLEYEYNPPPLVESQTFVIPRAPQTIPWGGTIAVPRFDPTLGQLVAIEFRLRGNFDGSVSVENLGPGTAMVTSDLTSSMFLQRPSGGGLITSVQRNISVPDTLAAFDGTVDFDGPSGETHVNLFQSAQQTAVSPPPNGDLAIFTGIAGAPGSVLLPISSTGTVNVSGSANISAQSTQTSGAELTGVYIYQPTSQIYCFGNGGLLPGCTPCPCNNDAVNSALTGCLNGSGAAAKLRSFRIPSVGSDTMRFSLESANSVSFGVLVSGDNRLPMPGVCPEGTGTTSAALDGLRCVGTNIQRHGSRATNGAGNSISPWGPPGGPPGGLIAQGGFSAGQTRHFQVFYRENPALGCGTGQNSSNGVTISFLP